VTAVITSIRIEALRGIRTGTVEGLSPLSVVVGPNNTGKSTVLDALLIGVAPVPRKAVAFVVRRRGAVEGGARWLFWRSGDRASVIVKTGAGVERRSTLARTETTIRLEFHNTGDWSNVTFADDNTVLGSDGSSLPPLEDVPDARLVEPHCGVDREPLYRVYTRALEEGRVEEVNALLRELLPETFRQVEILAPGDKPIVYITHKDHALPAGLQGDGVQSVLRLALELAAAPGGLVLLEEPEAAQHPRALHESARAIVAAVRRGVQVVLSTHSLDLIDMLRAHLGEDLPKLSVHHLACPAGEMSALRYSGAEVALARDAIGEDLR
jgi:predicted ATPase